MSNFLEYYKILGVSVGADIADITTSYKRLCRIHHPDVSNNPHSEELMKSINIAYAALRDKLKREAAFRERTTYTRPARRYTSPDARAQGPDARRMSAEAEKAALKALHGYFKALTECDYTSAYVYLSAHDKRYITRDSFIEWRKSVARIFQIKDFAIISNSTGATIAFSNEKVVNARKFIVVITEESITENSTQSGEVEKLVVYDNGVWKVFLGYTSVGELTRTFDEQFEAKRKQDLAKRWEEYYAGLCPEYNMFSLLGMRKAALREIYRQKRFGGTLTFAVISVKPGGMREDGQDELLRAAAVTINKALRETDTPAYTGDGVFAILFVELRKKNAGVIVGRLVENIRKRAGATLGANADIEYTFESWSGHNIAELDAMNGVLKKFRKKL